MNAVPRLFAPVMALALLSLPALRGQEVTAIRAGKVLTITDGTVEDVVILIENGRIKAVGKDIEVPWNAAVIDASDQVVAPAWIVAHSTGGIGGDNERMANVPFLSVRDSLDPSSPYFENCRRSGIGTIHVIPGNDTLLGGQGSVVRSQGQTVEDMTRRDHSGLKLSLKSNGGSRMAKIRGLRNALKDAVRAREEHERQEAEFAEIKDAGAVDADAEFDVEIDKLKQPILDLIDGELTGYLYVPGAAEIPEVRRLREQYPAMKLVLVLGPRCYEAATEIEALGLPVILDFDALEYLEQDPETEEETLLSPAAILAEAGVGFAITTQPEAQGGARSHPWWQLATLVRHGMSREAALRSLTATPAEILGIADEFGAIRPGMTADLQVLSDDPLLATAWVESLLLDGEIVYQREHDPRLRHLFGMEDEDDK